MTGGTILSPLAWHLGPLHRRQYQEYLVKERRQKVYTSLR